MPTKRNSTKAPTRVAAKKKSPTLKSKYKLNNKRFSTTLFAFIMLGALVGGYFLIKSRAESNCINQDPAVCSGFQATLPGPDKEVDGYNAEVTEAQFNPNVMISEENPNDGSCDRAYPYPGTVSDLADYAAYTANLTRNYGTNRFMWIDQLDSYVYSRKGVVGAERHIAPKLGGHTCGASRRSSGPSVAIKVKNTGTKSWLVGSDSSQPRLGVDSTGEQAVRWFGGLHNGYDDGIRGAANRMTLNEAVKGDPPPTKIFPGYYTNTKPSSVNPGESIWFQFNIRDISEYSKNKIVDCPGGYNRALGGSNGVCAGISKSGSYQIPLQMVVDGKYWFGNKIVVAFKAVNDLVSAQVDRSTRESWGYTYVGPWKSPTNTGNICYEGIKGATWDKNGIELCEGVPDGKISCTGPPYYDCVKGTGLLQMSGASSTAPKIKPNPANPWIVD